MKRTLTSIALATLLAGICLLTSTAASAQTEQASGSGETPESIESTCPPAQTFTFGSGATRFSFCISTHGNIQHLVSPSAYKHLTTAEGYIACGPGFNSSYDTGNDQESSGWNEPIAVSQPGGAHTFPLTIIRQSTDGRFQLRQVFDWEPEQRELFITMVLKNISAAPIADVMLGRYFDGDMDNEWKNTYDSDADSVWGRGTSSAVRHGLMLSALSIATPHATDAEDGSAWFYSKTTCIYSPQATPPLPDNDYVGRLTFKLGTLNPGQIKTVKMLYRRF